MTNHLTAPERETIIVSSDADKCWTITTWQRRIMTKLDKNPLAKKTAEHFYGTQQGATYTLDFNLITFRSKVRVLTDEQRQSRTFGRGSES